MTLLTLVGAPNLHAKAFSFAQISDIHMAAKESERDLEAVLDALATLRDPVDFIIVTGDLAEMGRENEFARCRSLLDSSEIPYFVLLGNHDVRWTRFSTEELREFLPGVPHFSFVHKGIHLIGLNTALPLEAWGDLSPAEQSWLTRQLDRFSPATPRFLFTHHPLLYPDADFTGDGMRFLHLAERANVVLVCSGHGHRFRRWTIDGVPFVMAPAVLKNRGFLVFRVGQKEVVGEVRSAGIDTPVAAFHLPLQRPVSTRTRNPLASTSVSIAPDGIRFRHVPTTGDLSVRLDAGPWRELVRSANSAQVRLPSLIPGQHVISLRLVMANNSLYWRQFSFAYGGRLLWKLPLRSRVQAPLCLERGLILVATGSGELTAIASRDGRVKWQRSLPGPVIKGLGCARDLAVVGTTNGLVCGYRIKDGALLWRFVVAGPMFAPPAIADSSVFVGTSRGHMLALRTRDGALRWRAGPFGMIQAPPAVVDSLLIFGSWDGHLRALSAGTGSPIWDIAPSPSPYAAPATAEPAWTGNAVFFCGAPLRPGMPGLYKASLDSGSILCSWAGSCHYASPMVSDTTVVVATLQGHLVGLASTDCQPLWDVSSAKAFYDASPVPDGTATTFYAVGLRGMASRLMTKEGRKIASHQFGNDFIFATPAARGDTIWVADLEGNVFAATMTAE